MESIVISGGHHSSALPVIDELKKRFPEIKIYWYGHKHSLKGSSNVTLEYQEITALGIPFYSLHAGKFYKTFSLFRLLKIPFGFCQAICLLVKHKPQAILSFGGYLGVPVVVAGWFLRIPSISHEQTVVIGYANVLISKFAGKILYTWDESLKHLPKRKAVHTGLPLRKDILKPRGKKFISGNNLPTIFVTAGKSGSHIINKAILSVLEELLQIANIVHQTGDHSRYEDYKKLKTRYEQIKTKIPGLYYVQKFISSEDIGDAYNQANLVISRSGAHTCVELMTLEKACVLIPIPWTSHNEQSKNAKVVEESGLGEIVDEKKLKDKEYFFKVVKDMLERRNMYSLKKPFIKVEQSAKLIVDEVQKIAKKS